MIILASNSPRRKELLAGLDIPFTVRTMEGIEENSPSTLPVDEIPVYLSQLKAKPYVLADDEVLVTADTIVAVDDEVLGKPQDKEDARRMLRLISGRSHEVITGVTIRKNGMESRSFACKTKVTFCQLSEEQIEYYIEKYQPYDKAGAYGIQEWIGYVGVTGIEGSYFNVMGLPVQRLSVELKPYIC